MSLLCKFCNSVWLIRSPEGRLVLEDGSDHNCPKAPWVLARKGRALARAYKKQEIKKIDDFAILGEAHDKINFWNSRLVGFKLELHTIRLEENPEGEGAKA